MGTLKYFKTILPALILSMSCVFGFPLQGAVSAAGTDTTGTTAGENSAPDASYRSYYNPALGVTLYWEPQRSLWFYWDAYSSMRYYWDVTYSSWFYFDGQQRVYTTLNIETGNGTYEPGESGYETDERTAAGDYNTADFTIENNVLVKYTGSAAALAIPSGVTSIGTSAFSGCRSLTSIIIPSTVRSIGKWAFYGCTGLTEIEIPAGVSQIGNGAFDGCTGLANINVVEGNYNYASVDGILYDYTQTAIIKCPSQNAQSAVVLPE